MNLKHVMLSVLVLSTVPVVASADDTLTGSTTTTAKVIKGDLTLKVADTVEFGEKPLADTVDFGEKGFTDFSVTNHTGTYTGYVVNAQLSADDAGRTLKVNGVELKKGEDQPVVTVAAKDDTYGEQPQDVKASLQYTGLTTLGDHTSQINFTLTQVTPSQIAE